MSIGLELESQKSMSAKSHRLSSLNPTLREGKIGDSASSVMSVNSSTIITSERYFIINTAVARFHYLALSVVLEIILALYLKRKIVLKFLPARSDC